MDACVYLIRTPRRLIEASLVESGSVACPIVEIEQALPEGESVFAREAEGNMTADELLVQLLNTQKVIIL
ncbi:MAG: hypothetical protein U0412_03160 [Nitrospira sp.]